MNKFIKPFIYAIEFLIISSFLVTSLNYIGILNSKISSILRIISIIISFFINGYLVGKNSIKKGWLSGLEAGSILVSIMILLDLLFKVEFNFKIIIYYAILLVISILGSVIGINKKRNE